MLFVVLINYVRRHIINGQSKNADDLSARPHHLLFNAYCTTFR